MSASASIDPLSLKSDSRGRWSCRSSLERLTWEGAALRYPDGVPDKVKANLRHELDLIEKLGYAPYFLTVDAIVRYARSQDILSASARLSQAAAITRTVTVSHSPAANSIKC